MQGVAYALGYEYCAITNKKDMPGFWFQSVIDEMKNELAVYHADLEDFLNH